MHVQYVHMIFKKYTVLLSNIKARPTYYTIVRPIGYVGTTYNTHRPSYTDSSVIVHMHKESEKIRIKRGVKVKVKVWFYIALYPVRWTAQSALHFPPLADLFIPAPFTASLGSILAMHQLRNDYSITFPPLSIARHSFIQLSRLRRLEVKENAQTSKR